MRIKMLVSRPPRRKGEVYDVPDPMALTMVDMLEAEVATKQAKPKPLEDHTVAQLRVFAAERQIPIKKDAKKAEIIAALESGEV